MNYNDVKNLQDIWFFEDGVQKIIMHYKDIDILFKQRECKALLLERGDK